MLISNRSLLRFHNAVSADDKVRGVDVLKHQTSGWALSVWPIQVN